MPKEGLNFIDNLDMNTLNHSAANMQKLYTSQTPYSHYINYSQSVSGIGHPGQMFY